MNKKIIYLSLISLLLVGCSKKEKTYTVTWANEDGTILEVDYNVVEGTLPTYDGETPKSDKDDNMFNHIFNGWSPEVTPVISDITYFAQYSLQYIDYTVTFNNYDDTVISSKTYHYGDTIEIPSDPNKESTNTYGYTFTGWDKEVSPICKGSVTYTAQYAEYYNEYLVKFVNPDGTVISSKNYHYGDTIEAPTNPTFASDDVYDYTFVEWDNEVATTCTSSVTYTAKYSRAYNQTYFKSVGVIPDVNLSKMTLTYGLYPKTHVNDTDLVKKLNALTDTEDNGYYLYNNRYYAKVVAKPDRSGYTFDDGTIIKASLEYWFKCEPISWNIINVSGSTFTLLSSYLVDARVYHSSTEERTIDGVTIYPNNYKYSDLRAWLIGDFYKSAFTLNDALIQTVTVDNSATSAPSTTPSSYLCDNTDDKVYLLSYKDYINPDYGFTSDTGDTALRQAVTTDYARANGAYNDTGDILNCGFYWTRTPSANNIKSVIDNNASGLTGVGYRVDYGYSCVRPAIQIKF